MMVHTPMMRMLYTTSMPVIVAIASAGRNITTLMRPPTCMAMHSALAIMRIAG
jgi:hypothetical protein